MESFVDFGHYDQGFGQFFEFIKLLVVEFIELLMKKEILLKEDRKTRVDHTD
jgi:hypothetical protein